MYNRHALFIVAIETDIEIYRVHQEISEGIIILHLKGVCVVRKYKITDRKTRVRAIRTKCGSCAKLGKIAAMTVYRDRNKNP